MILNYPYKKATNDYGDNDGLFRLTLFGFIKTMEMIFIRFFPTKPKYYPVLMLYQTNGYESGLFEA